jgi:two-component system, OmpR family, response regulator
LAAGTLEALPEPFVLHLREAGMRVAIARDQTAMFAALDPRPSLVVLDLDKLGEDGLDVMRRLRAGYDGALILVTAQRRDLADCVLGLEMGADDYLVSPIDLRELTARIRTILRRRSLARRLIEGAAFTRLRFGAWDLDGATRLLRQDGEAPVRLTRREFDLLSAFLRAPRKVLSREDLLRATGAPGDLFDRAIDTQIRRLRGKLRSGRQGRAVIETVRGVGYALQAEVEPA